MTFCSDAGERDELLRRFTALELSNSNSKNRENNSSSTYKKPGIPSSNTAPALSAQAWPRGLPRVPSSSSSSSSFIAPGAGGAMPMTSAPGQSQAAVSQGDTQALSEVLSALRKLREGIVASKRKDAFAVQAYLFCIRVSVLVKHSESYHPAILHLLHHASPVPSTLASINAPTPAPAPALAPAPASTPSSTSGSASTLQGGFGSSGSRGMPMTSVELAEVVGYLVLDAACRRGDLAEAHMLRRRWRLRDAKVDAALRALVHDNWVEFGRLRRHADGYRARILEFADAPLRRHALKCFARSYLTVDLEFLERSADADWAHLTADEGVGWELEDSGSSAGKKVVIRRVKGKS